jgi:hypothetical protein
MPFANYLSSHKLDGHPTSDPNIHPPAYTQMHQSINDSKDIKRKSSQDLISER